MMLTSLSTAAALLLLLVSVGAASPAPAIGMPGCDTTCGDVRVPYPFGIGPASSCYHSPGFNLTCDRSSNPPRLLLGDGTLQVNFIDLWEPSMLVMRTAGDIKVGADGSGSLGGGLGGPYALSSRGNELVLTGCNVRATLKKGDVTMSGCSSFCDDDDGPIQDPYVPSKLESSMLCSGIGCCQANIAVKREQAAGKKQNVFYDDVQVQLEWLGRNRSVDQERMPARVFVARERWFEQNRVSGQLLQTPSKDTAVEAVPVWLDYEVGAGHGGAEPPAGSNITCSKGTRGGYTCLCKEGYEGNPYITGGCTDINECEQPEGNPCPGDRKCFNTQGSFNCGCPPGTHGNHTLPGGCVPSVTGTGACNRVCGDVAVPYPFGIGPSHCYRPGFNLTCDDTSSGKPPRLLLDDSGAFQVVNISLQNTTLRVTSAITIIRAFTKNNYAFDFNFSNYFTDREQALYSLSTRNELIVTGCNVQATLPGRGNGPAIISGCATFCSDNDTDAGVPSSSSRDKYCYGMGCCQARISTSMDGMPDELRFKFADLNNVKDNMSMPPYALIAEEGWFQSYRQRVSDQLLQEYNSQRRTTSALEVPIVLDWEILHRSLPPANASSQHANCPTEVAGSICKSKNSHCKPGNRGYTCHCDDGYDGNPYQLVGGCRGGSKSLKGKGAIIGVASGAGIVILTSIAFFIYKKLKYRRAQILKRKFFEQNHGQLLQQLVSQRANIAERMIISLEELEKATNNFDKSRELGGGGHVTVYKGILSDLHVVAIKKPKKIVQKETDEFINEVAILSQINNRNVVKLYGCCLETEVPMLVYEFISNGTLYDHLHVEGPRSLSWDNRLRIAIEAAKSLAYLHSTASIPIVHRDVKSVNILLDDTLTAKVADFGASRYISIEKSGLTTMVQGTIGYLDPMYFYTGRFTEKSDVYSFGVMLVELLTRKKPFSYMSPDGEGLAAHFVTLFVEGNLLHILDPQVMDEGGKDVEEVAALAVACVKLRGEYRPTMRQVELTLENLQSPEQHVVHNVVVEKYECNNIAINSLSTKGERSSEGSTRQYSMEEEFLLSARFPR